MYIEMVARRRPDRDCAAAFELLLVQIRKRFGYAKKSP